MPPPRRVLPDGRPAPRLWIKVQCPACLVSEVVDAYNGVPLCGCREPKPIMKPERIVDPADVVET